MDFYEKMKASEAKYREDNKKKIEECLKETPQHVLWAKGSVSESFEGSDEECFTFRHREKFGFSEVLVNKLMHFAYLKGSSDIDSKSYNAGYEACREKMVKQLGEFLDND